MTANVTGQDAADVSEQLTSVWNGFNVGAEEAELYVDRLAVAAAITASDLGELSDAMSRVASTASVLGVSEEQLASQLATIISITRGAPESIGTAMRNIFSRMSDIQAGMSDDGATLDYYTKQMAALGINVLDTEGRLRDMGEVIEEVGGDWANYSREQQIAIAQTMAGTRQFNNLIALFDNWDMYTSTLDAVNNAQGALQEQQDIYMESTRAHLQQLGTQWEDLFDSFFDPQTISNGADALAGVVNLVTQLVDALGGGGEALTAFGAIAMNVFGTQISNGIFTQVTNIQNAIQSIRNASEQLDIARSLDQGQFDPVTNEIAHMQAQAQQFDQYWNESQSKRAQEIIKEVEAVKQEAAAWQEATDRLIEYSNNTAHIDPADANGDFDYSMTRQSFNAMSEDELESFSHLLERSQDRYNEITKAVTEYRSLLSQANKLNDDQNVGLEEQNQLYGQIYEVNNRIKNLLTEQKILTQDVDEATAKRLQTMLDHLEDAENQAKQNYGENRIGEGLAAGGSNRLRAGLDDAARYAKQNADAAEEAYQTVLNQMNNYADQLQGKMNNAQKSYSEFSKLVAQPQTINALVDTASAAMSLFSAIQSIQNLGAIWTNEDISNAERMMQTFMAFSNILLQGVSGAAMLAGAMKTLVPIAKAAWAAVGGAAVLGPIGLVVAAVGGLAIAYSAVTGSAERAAEKQRDAMQEAKDNIDANNASLEDLNAQLQANQQKIDEINAKPIKELVDQQDLNNLQIQNTLLEAKINLLNRQNEIEQERAQNAYENQLDYTIQELHDASSEQVSVGVDAEGEQISFAVSDIEGFQAWKKSYVEEINSLREEAINTGNEAMSVQASFMEASLRAAEEDFLAMNQAYVDQLSTRATEALEYLASNPEDENAIQQSQLILRLYYEATGTYKQIVAEGLKQVVQANNEDWQNILSDISSIDLGNFDETTWQNIFGDELWEDISEQADAAGLSIRDFFAAMADEDGVIILQEVNDQIKENASSAEDAAKSGADYVDSIYELSDALSKGSYTDLDKDQLTMFNELEKEYSALSAIQDKSSHEYLETLRQINEMIEDNERAEREAALESEKQRANALRTQKSLYERGYLSTFDVEVNADKLEDSIDSILQQEHELNLEVNVEDINTDITQSFDFISEYQRIIDTIPDSLQITVAEAEQLIQAGYGQMLIGAQATAEGMIQLNQAQRDAFIQMKQDELEASRQSYLEQLQSERELVSYQIQALEARLSMLETVQQTNDVNRQRELLAEANQQTQLYDTYAKKLTEQLKADKDYSHEAGVVADSLEEYRQSAFEIALKNQQLDESDATTQQAREVNRRIENLAKYYQALVSIGAATQEAMSGQGVTTSFNGGRATGGGGVISSQNFSGQGRSLEDLSESLKIEPLDIEDIMDEYARGDSYGDEKVQEQIDATRQALEIWKDVLGDLDGTIAAFEAVPNLFDQIGVDNSDSGSSQKGSTPNHKEIDLYNDRPNPFDEINEELSIYEANLEALEATQDHVYGKSYIKNLNDQLKVIEQIRDAEERRLEIANQQRDKLTGELTGLGFSFTEQGVLDRTQLNNAKDYYDQLATQYNNMTAEQQESDAGVALEKQIEDQKLLIEVMEAAISDWETMNKEYQDAQTNIAGLDDKVKEIKDNLLPGEQLDMLAELLDILEQFADITDLIDDRLSALADEQEHLVGDNLIKNLSDQIATLDVKKLTVLVDGIKDLGSAMIEFKNVKNNFSNIVKQLKELSKYNDVLEADYGITGIDESQLNGTAEGIGYIASKLGELMQVYNQGVKGDQGNDIMGLITGIIGTASGNPLGIIQLVISALSLITNIIGTIRNLFDQWRKIQEEQIQLQIERFNVPVDVTLNLYDLQKQWNEFRRNVIDDIADNDFIGQIEASLREIQQYYNGLDFSIDSSFDSSAISSANSLIGVLSGHLATVMEEINKMNAGEKSDIYGDHLADALEDMENYTEQLMNALTDISQLEDEIYDAYLSGWDEIRDGLQEQVEEYDRIQNEIEHNKNILSMLYGDDAYDELDAFYQLEEKANSGRIQYLVQAVREWDEIKQKMIESGETSGEAWDKVVDAQQEAQEQLNQALEDAIQSIIDRYQNTIKSIFNDMTDKLTGGMGLDYMQDQWDLITDRADRYLDDINRAYEITQLQSKVQDAINDNDGNLQAQEQIRDVMDEQLAYLENKENLTQYDVERAEKLLDIELKRLALQNAQQNQTTMRLRRDANGNYSYEYVADEDAIQKGEDELAAAENELYNFDKDQYNQNLQDIFNMYQSYNEKMQQIAMDNTLTEEERLQYMTMLNQEYQDQLNMLVGDNETIRNNLTQSAFAAYAELYNINKEQFIQMTEEEKNAFMGNLVETWNSGLQQMADAIAGEGGFQNIANNALQAIKEAQDAYNESLEQTKADIDGLDFTNFQESIDNILATTEDTIGANEEVIDTYDSMADQLIAVNQQAQQYLATLQAQNEAIYEQIQAALELQAVTNVPGVDQNKDEDAPWWYDALVNVALPGGLIGNIITGGEVSNATWNGLKDLFGFDTGGYTGDWNNGNGRLAVLHEKELVLNQDDTSNILQTVDYVRQMSSINSDLPRQIAEAIQNNLNNRLEDMIAASRPDAQQVEPSAYEIEQNVRIEANFPNATNRDEIEQAFSNLVNIAAQRAMDTRI